jgi:hypothetical protein
MKLNDTLLFPSNRPSQYRRSATMGLGRFTFYGDPGRTISSCPSYSVSVLSKILPRKKMIYRGFDSVLRSTHNGIGFGFKPVDWLGAGTATAPPFELNSFWEDRFA